MDNHIADWTRKKFIYSMAASGALMMLRPFRSWSMPAAEIDPRVAAIIANYICMDTHNHVDVPLDKDELPGPDIDLASEMVRAGMSAISMTFAVDYHPEPSPAGYDYNRFISGLDAMDIVLKKNKIERATSFADLQNAHQQKKPIVIQSVEGCHFLEGKIERVEEAYNRGLRHLGLLHDSDAMVPLGDVYTNKPQFGGLTEFGTQVIKECNRLGILVDMAHADNNTINGAIKVSEHPILISHTGLATQLNGSAQMIEIMRPRLISKEQAKIVANNGGVIGLWIHLAETPLAFAQNIRAMVDVIGVEHVAIGTDTKLTPPYKSPKPENNNRPVPKNMEKIFNHLSGLRTNNIWDGQKAGFYYTVADAMLKTGFTEEEIGKIAGGNYCRLFKAAIGK